MMRDHQSRSKRDKKKILISAKAQKIEVDQPTLESKSMDLLLAMKDRDLDQKISVDRRSNQYNYSGHQKFTS